MRKLCLLVLALWSFSQGAVGQEKNEQLTRLLQTFQTYQANWPVEKVFLHLDKTEYVEGETIWFKSYLTAGPEHKPSGLSNHLYVELVDANGNVKKRLTVRSTDGNGQGSMVILPTWTDGYYYLRAYTEWMKNWDPAFFFRKKIKIYALGETPVLQEKVTGPDLTIDFFPEGGNLIPGVPNRVAFEISGYALGETPVKGKVFDQNGQEVTQFASMHEGRGFFALNPVGSGYYARIEGSSRKFELPAATPNSATIIANNNDPGFLNISVKTDRTDAGAFNVLVHTRGFLSYAAQIPMRGTRGFTRVNKNQLAEGISHLTLFDLDGTPLAERLVFIDKSEGLGIKITAGQPSYRDRDLVELDLEVKDHLGQPVQGSFSLSAIDLELVQNDQVDYDIRTNLLLQSDLRGFIKKPSQYFSDDPQAARKLDLLMMVNGWRRFQWDALENQQLAEPDYYPEQALTVSGQISRNKKQEIKNGQVFLYAQGVTDSKGLVFTDAAGNFKFTGQHFTDTTLVTVQAFQRQGNKRLTLQLDTSFSQMPLKSYRLNEPEQDFDRLARYKESQLKALIVDSIYRGERITDLGEVEIQGTNQIRRREMANLAPSSATNLGTRVDFSEIDYDERRKRNPYQILVGRAPGFVLRPPDLSQESESFLPQPRLGGGSSRNGIPIIFIDGMPQHFEMVFAYTALQIDFATTYSGTPGVISFRTLSNEEYRKLVPGPPSFFSGKLPGYHVAKEFYAPKHDGSNTFAGVPDIRTTLHWAPMIQTDANGKAQISFYLPDETRKVRVALQGLSESGSAGATHIDFDVRR